MYFEAGKNQIFQTSEFVKKKQKVNSLKKKFSENTELLNL